MIFDCFHRFVPKHISVEMKVVTSIFISISLEGGNENFIH